MDLYINIVNKVLNHKMRDIKFKSFSHANKKENIGLISGPLLFIVILFSPFPHNAVPDNAPFQVAIRDIK